MLSITKNRNTENKEDLGEYIVDTNAYIKDLKTLEDNGVLGDRVMNEDLDVGHQDNEPAMVKKQLYNIIRNAKNLYDKLGKYETGEEVDFPSWWQSKITKSQSYLSGAFNYLDSEEAVSESLQLVHVYDKDGKMYGTGSVEKVEGDKTTVRFDGNTVKRFPSDRVKPVKEVSGKLNEWGSSDQHAMNSSIHRDLGQPTEFPGLTQIMSAAEEAVDFYWDDWEEYKTDREGLVMHATQMYANRMFPEFMDGMRKMFAPANEGKYKSDAQRKAIYAAKAEKEK